VKIGVEFARGIFGTVVDANIKDLAHAATFAVGYAGPRLRERLRLDTGPVLGQGVANAWGHGGPYPEGQEAMSAASLVYTKAPDIIRAFSRGALIKPTGLRGKYLPVPTSFNRTGRRGGRTSKAKDKLGLWVGVKVTPQQMIDSGDAFIWKRGTRRLWMLPVLGRSGGRTKTGRVKPQTFAGRFDIKLSSGRTKKTARLFGAGAVPMYALLSQVQLRKLLDNDRRSSEAADDMVRAFVTAARVNAD
jgi:hypothetical protein